MYNRVKNTFQIIRSSFLERGTLKPLGIAVAIMAFHALITIDGVYLLFQKEKYANLQSDIVSLDSSFEDSVSLNQFLRLDFNAEDESILRDSNDIILQKYNLTTNEIIFWSKKSAILPPEVIKSAEGQLRLVSIDDRPILVRSKQVGSEALIKMIDLTDYVKKHYYPKFNLHGDDGRAKPYQINGFSSENGFQFHDKRDQFLFCIVKANSNDDLRIIIGLIFILFEFFFLIKGINNFSRRISDVYPFVGCLVFFLILYNFRKLFSFLRIPEQFYTLKLFNPALYKSSVNSLGDLLIFIITTQLIILFIRRNLKIDYQLLKSYKLEFIVHTLTITILLGEAFSMSKIFFGLVVESSIWFNFNYFPRLTIYSFIGLAIMLMTFTNYYLLSNFLVQLITKLRLSPKRILLSLGLNILLIVLAFVFLKLRFEVYVLFIVLILVLSISYGIYYLRRYSRNFDIALFLFFASTVTTYLLYINNTRKDSLILSSIASNIAFGKNKEFEKNLANYINQKNKDFHYEDSVLMKKIYLRRMDAYQYHQLINSPNVEEEISPTLRLINEDNERYYISEYREDSVTGFWIILPSNYLNKISSSTKESINELVVRDQNISYALYQNDSLIEHFGDYHYRNKYVSADFDQRKLKDKSYSIENKVFIINERLKAIITTSEVQTLSLVTQFSYVFCFNIILFILIEILSYSLNIGHTSDFVLKYSSLRSKIVLTFFFLIVTIFVGITYFSYVNLNNKFRDYNRDQLIKELKGLQFSLKNSMENNVPISKLTAYLLQSSDLSNNVNMLYSSQGLQIFRSATSVNNLTIDPSIYKRLIRDKEIILNENVNSDGRSSFEAFGLLVNQSTGEQYILSVSNSPTIGFKNEATKLIVALLNLYVILFFVSMIIAFWISNAITRPLQLIASKLPFIQLSKKNEYLRYEYDDEIGDLVKKYNHMLDEIERSTRQLVYQEREEAWTEMAKQIAHEIKNPLTPMKLKMQYLQKKIVEGNADIEKLTLGVSETLIEQINNLDMIASSFSEFAKLHQPQIEEADWYQLIRKVSNIFDNNQVKIKFHSDLESAPIRCDQNQMISCINNLIKNAIQSHDDETGILINLNLSIVRNQYQLLIQDFGKGISPENLSKVFIPNFTTKSSGSGLGLPITKKIINSFQGTIELDSQLGKGTCFYICLPILESFYTKAKQYSEMESQWIQQGLVDLSKLDLVVDLKYAADTNIFRKRLYKSFSNPIGTEIMNGALSKAVELLKKENARYRFILWDALRPHAIQQDMWDSYDGEDRNKYIAPPNRSSMHNYGMAVDLGIVYIHPDVETEYKLIDFGSEFDDFSEISHSNYMLIEEAAIDHRQLLKRVMLEAGFSAYENEWWHFEIGEKEWVKSSMKRW